MISALMVNIREKIKRSFWNQISITFEKLLLRLAMGYKKISVKVLNKFGVGIAISSPGIRIPYSTPSQHIFLALPSDLGVLNIHY